MKNLTAFTGGTDARTYQAVAQHDLDTLTATLKTALGAQIPQAFSLQAGEALSITRCAFHATSNHPAGAEAQSATINASQTCAGVAYSQGELQQQATRVFTTRTSPGAKYTLVAGVIPTIIAVSPMTVSIRGLWVYTFSQSDEQYFAEQIAGDTPAQARAYLLKTGFITLATIPVQLPKDSAHIHFLTLIGA